MNSGEQNTSVIRLKASGRLGSRKSKKGCLTCKQRKVKCGEETPVCRRCVDAGRECLGYNDVFVPMRVASTEPDFKNIRILGTKCALRTPLRSSSSILSASESRALEYYQIKVAAALGGAVDDEFWTKSILQLSQCESAICHSLVAVSNSWEGKEQGNTNLTDIARRRSIKLYNKALVATSQRVAEPGAETVALATCVLFLCLHCLQGDLEQASKLLDSGSAVMSRLLRETCDSTKLYEHATVSTFLPVFERLNVLLRLFGNLRPPFRSSRSLLSGNIKESFGNMQSFQVARNMLYWLIAESHDLIISTRSHRHGKHLEHSVLQHCLQRQALQLVAYDAWKQGFDQLCAQEHNSSTPESHKVQMRLNHGATVVWLSVCLETYESAYDRYWKQFEYLVKQAERMVFYRQQSKDAHIATKFQFEMGIIPPMYLVALKCRDFELRTRALAILQKAPEQEGFWDREEALCVARRVVDLETMANIVVVDGRQHLLQDAKIVDTKVEYSDHLGTHAFFSVKFGNLRAQWKETILAEPRRRQSSSDLSVRKDCKQYAQNDHL